MMQLILKVMKKKHSLYKSFKILATGFLITILPYAVSMAQDRTADIKLRFNEDGDSKLITATVTETFGDSLGEPVPDLDLYFFVERTFRPLPIGDIFNTTDEEGNVTIEFPADLPGDSMGYVNVIARIQDSDEFEESEVTQKIRWGVPLETDNQENKRSLWAAGANAPIPLLILVNTLILTAWSIIIYLIFQLYKISRM